MGKSKKKEPQLHPYKVGFLSFLPIWFKVIFFKGWVVGIGYFFLAFGTAFLTPGSFEQMFAVGAAIGLLNSYVVSTVVRDLTRLEDEQNPYLSVKRKGPMGTLTNIVLSLVIVILVGYTYDGINRLIIFIFKLDDTIVYLPAEPIGFALIYLAYDFIWRKLTFRRTKKIDSNKADQDLSREDS